MTRKPGKCPVCNSGDTHFFLYRKCVPVHQNLVICDEHSASHIARGDLNMAVCHMCGFVYNDAFDPLKLSYSQDYDNTQSHSQYFEHYMEELARYLIEEQGIRQSRIIEVGCGKGTFLKMLLKNKSLGNTGIGFDPSYVGPDSDLNGRLKFKRHFYGPDFSDVTADIVVCRHVIEHIQHPVELLREIRKTLDASKNARIYFETPCVEWILKNHVIWDFFYEHCSLFTAETLTTAFQIAGFHVDRIKHVFHDQYLWIEASVAISNEEIHYHPAKIPSMAAQFSQEEQKLGEDWLHKVHELREQGKVAIWGAGAKGTTFANLIDPEKKYIDCIIDVNPNKQGHFVPGTGHPIVGIKNLAARNIKNAILMNPNYREENLDLLNKSGLKIKLVE